MTRVPDAVRPLARGTFVTAIGNGAWYASWALFLTGPVGLSPGAAGVAMSLAGADRIWYQAYSDGVATVHLSVGYFAYERPGAEIASSSHHLAGPHPRAQTGAYWRTTGTPRQDFDAKALVFGYALQPVPIYTSAHENKLSLRN